MSLFRYLVLGALAGAAGTAAMDLVLYRRYQRGGGEDSLWQWEFAGGVTNWDQASAPGQSRREAGALRHGPATPGRLGAAHDQPDALGHGHQLGRSVRSRWPAPTSRLGLLRALALGPTAWLASYVILPLFKVYKPIWEYDAQTLGDDLSAHLVFGTATSAVFAALSGGMTCNLWRRPT